MAGKVLMGEPPARGSGLNNVTLTNVCRKMLTWTLDLPPLDEGGLRGFDLVRIFKYPESRILLET